MNSLTGIIQQQFKPPCSPHVLTQAPYQVLNLPPPPLMAPPPCFQHLWETLGWGSCIDSKPAYIIIGLSQQK